MEHQGENQKNSRGKERGEHGFSEQLKWGLTAFWVLAAIALVVYLIFHPQFIFGALRKITGILMPIIYGAIFAYLMSPIYNGVRNGSKKLLEKRVSAASARSLSKTAGTAAAVLVLIFIVASLAGMVLPELISSVTRLANNLPKSSQKFYDLALQKLEGHPDLREALEEYYVRTSDFLSNYVQNNVMPNISNIVSSLGSGVWNVVRVLKNIILGLIVMAYLLNLKELLLAQAIKIMHAILHKKEADWLIAELRYVDRMFGGFIVGKIVDSVIIGILTFFILGFMNMPYVMLVSVIVGVTNVIPFFGPFIGAIPSFVLIVLTSPMQGLYFLIVILVIQQLDGNVIGPRILGNSTGLSSFWVLFSILLFGGLFGFAGMIIAVPSWAVILNLLRQWTERRLREQELSTDTRAYMSGRSEGKIPGDSFANPIESEDPIPEER